MYEGLPYTLLIRATLPWEAQPARARQRMAICALDFSSSTQFKDSRQLTGCSSSSLAQDLPPDLWKMYECVVHADSCFLFLILANFFFLPKNWDHNSYSSNKNVFYSTVKKASQTLTLALSCYLCGAATMLKHDHHHLWNVHLFQYEPPSAPGFLYYPFGSKRSVSHSSAG